MRLVHKCGWGIPRLPRLMYLPGESTATDAIRSGQRSNSGERASIVAL
jgi:hypothetical protein